MTTETDICNLALSHIGSGSIASFLAEQSHLAVECRKLYPSARDTVLRDHEWGFAERRDALALTTGITPVGYEYAYAYPLGCIRALRIWKEAKDTPPYEFIINASDSLTQKVILTDIVEAVLVYTARVVHPNVYDDAFIYALSYRLATDLAIPITKKPQIAVGMAAVYDKRMAETKKSDSDEQVKKKNTYNELANARL